MLIGIDDTDSRKGMCTTYLCAVLVSEFREAGLSVSLPYLVRLNPCIPQKTRGNGAVCIDVSTAGRANWEEYVKERVISRIEELAFVEDENTHPGAVFAYDAALEEIRNDRKKCEKLLRFYERAVKGVLELEDALCVISELNLEYFKMKSGRGLIGALAAVSFAFAQKYELQADARFRHSSCCSVFASERNDLTYELLAYREKERWGTPREIEEESVWNADRATYPLTWDTVDVKNRKIVFAPHSPCPVLFGIRGDSIPAILKAARMIRSEPIALEMLFVTNQGTDAHLLEFCSEAKELKDYHSYIIDGVVVKEPRNIAGGHVVFSIAVQGNTQKQEQEEERKKEKSQERCESKLIDCIAYEPTKQFRDVVRKLRVGDEVTVFGSFKRNTVNLEKMLVRSVVRRAERNPRCPVCGKRMESAGRGQGFRCKRCKTHKAERELEPLKRDLEEGFYEVPPVARRHISKPLVRMREDAEKFGFKIFPSR